MVTDEAVKKTKKKAQEGAIHSPVKGNFLSVFFIPGLKMFISLPTKSIFCY